MASELRETIKDRLIHYSEVYQEQIWKLIRSSVDKMDHSVLVEFAKSIGIRYGSDYELSTQIMNHLIVNNEKEYIEELATRYLQGLSKEKLNDMYFNTVEIEKLESEE